MAQLATSYEVEGYDGTHGKSRWWIEAWGVGSKADWYVRSEAGPPTPSELRHADYVVIGIRHPNGHVTYRTHTGGLDLDPRAMRR